MPGEPSKHSAPPVGLAALGIAAFAVICCAALPLLAALAESAAIGVLLGVGAGLVAAVVLGGVVVARGRRRRTGEPRSAAASEPDDGASARAGTRESWRLRF